MLWLSSYVEWYSRCVDGTDNVVPRVFPFTPLLPPPLVSVGNDMVLGRDTQPFDADGKGWSCV